MPADIKVTTELLLWRTLVVALMNAVFVPVMQGASPLAAVVFAFFEYVF
jgi:hypothetical protein